MKKIVNRFAFFSIFFDNLFLPLNVGFDFRLNYLVYLFFIFFYLLAFKKVILSAKRLASLVTIFVVLLLVALVKEPPLGGFVKQTVLILFHLVFAFLLVNAYNFDLKRIVTDYVLIVKWICFVAIVQFVSLRFGFAQGANFSYLGFDMGNFFMGQNRAQGWFQEPSFLAYAIMPAVFMAVAKLFGIGSGVKKHEALLILAVMFMSASSTGLLGLLLAILFVLLGKYPILKKPVYLFGLISLVPIMAILVYQVPMVKERVDDSLALFIKREPTTEDINNTNLSTYALYSNFRVSQQTVAEDPLVGGGLGSYEYNYDRHINSVIPESPIRDRYQLNKKDANSLFLRLLAETGILGVFAFFSYIGTERLKFETVSRGYGYLWALSNGIFVLILLRLLRQGHYTSLGFVLFLLLLYSAKNKASQNG